jgi:hypothetical protein
MNGILPVCTIAAGLVLSAGAARADKSMHCINNPGQPDYDVSYVQSTLRIITPGKADQVYPNVFSDGPLKVTFDNGRQLEANMWDGRPYNEEGPHMILRDKVGNVLTHNECDQLREW